MKQSDTSLIYLIVASSGREGKSAYRIVGMDGNRRSIFDKRKSLSYSVNNETTMHGILSGLAEAHERAIRNVRFYIENRWVADVVGGLIGPDATWPARTLALAEQIWEQMGNFDSVRVAIRKLDSHPVTRVPLQQLEAFVDGRYSPEWTEDQRQEKLREIENWLGSNVTRILSPFARRVGALLISGKFVTEFTPEDFGRKPDQGISVMVTGVAASVRREIKGAGFVMEDLRREFFTLPISAEKCERRQGDGDGEKSARSDEQKGKAYSTTISQDQAG